MGAKDIKFDRDGQEAILKGINILADAVKATLGPRGRNVLIEKTFGAPVVTKDGVTVAKEIELEDRFEKGAVVDMAALQANRLVREINAPGIKVLGRGEIKKALQLKVNKISAEARKKVEAAGGKVELL